MGHPVALTRWVVLDTRTCVLTVYRDQGEQEVDQVLNMTSSN